MLFVGSFSRGLITPEDRPMTATRYCIDILVLSWRQLGENHWRATTTARCEQEKTTGLKFRARLLQVKLNPGEFLLATARRAYHKHKGKTVNKDTANSRQKEKEERKERRRQMLQQWSSARMMITRLIILLYQGRKREKKTRKRSIIV